MELQNRTGSSWSWTDGPGLDRRTLTQWGDETRGKPGDGIPGTGFTCPGVNITSPGCFQSRSSQGAPFTINYSRQSWGRPNRWHHQVSQRLMIFIRSISWKIWCTNKVNISINWTFCHEKPETFVICSGHVSLFRTHLYYENVILGFHHFNHKDAFFFINMSLFLSKFHLHKSRFTSRKPELFLLKVEQDIRTISRSKNCLKPLIYTLTFLSSLFLIICCFSLTFYM